MPTADIVQLLIAERDRIDQAIAALQGPKRRGRQPREATGDSPAQAMPKPRKKRTFTKAQRAKAAARMRKYWAAKRKQG